MLHGTTIILLVVLSTDYLLRKNKKIKKRWWVVDGVRGTVTKYSSENKTDRRGKPIRIVHADTKIVQEGPELEFTLQTPGRQVRFVANSIEERDAWIDALIRCSKGYASGESKKFASRGLLNGKYAFVRELGKGSSAVVRLYTCHGQPYAVKKYLNASQRSRHLKSSPSSTLEQPDMILREIAIMKKVSRMDNVVTLHEVISDPVTNELYLVMEYLGGGPVMEWNAERRKYLAPGHDNCLSEAVSKQYMKCTVQGLIQLHANQLCHRDIKPANLLTSEDGQVCKIADFGEAHMFEKEEGQTLKNTRGTYHFMAPETLTGEEYCGFKADIWALGVTLYTFIYGILPFDSTNVLELFDNIQNDPLTFPVTIGSTPLRDLLTQMLEKDPEKRISLEGILNHRWFGRSTRFHKNAAFTKIVTVSDTDISNAISSLQSKVDSVRAASRRSLKRVMNSLYTHEKVYLDLNEEAQYYYPTPIDTSMVEIPASIVEAIEIIAEQDHFIWCQTKIFSGWTFAKDRNDEMKQHPAILPYFELSNNHKETNRQCARATITSVVALGYRFIKHHHHHHHQHVGPFDLPKVSLPESLTVLSELLAENAHEVWCLDHILKGWTYGETYDKDTKTHPSLVPFELSPVVDRKANTEAAVSTLKTLVQLGYVIEHRHKKHHQRNHAALCKS